MKAHRFEGILWITALFAGLLPMTSIAQEEGPAEDRMSYYERRAGEDAAFEQSLQSDGEEGQEDFWKARKAYEKALKKRDKSAYRAYMQGKRDAYASHFEHCGHRCHHSRYYYYHAGNYYHGYRVSYHRYPRRSGNTVKVRVATPRVRLFL